MPATSRPAGTSEPGCWIGSTSASRGDSGQGPPGTVLDEALLVATGRDALRLARVQAPGRAAMAADAFLRGRKVPAGTRLG